MRAADCLPSSVAPPTPTSTWRDRFDSADDDGADQDVVEVVRSPLGEVLLEVQLDRSWRARESSSGRSVRGVRLVLPNGHAEAAVVKVRDTDRGGEEAVRRWQAEVAVYDTTRSLSPDRHSAADDLNAHLQRSGHPGRVPTCLGWWRRTTRPELVLAISRLEGRTLRDLVTDHHGRLPMPAALAIMRSLACFVHAAHQVGLRLGDINAGNVLVVGDLDQPETLYVNVVDLELTDHLSSSDEDDRRAWASIVEPAYRWRIHAGRLTTMYSRAERALTMVFASPNPGFGFESDLASLGIMCRVAFTGTHELDDANYPAEVPGPHRWLQHHLDRTSDLIERMRSGQQPELKSAAVYGEWLDLLTPSRDEPSPHYFSSVEAQLPCASSGLAESLYEWGEGSEDVVVRLQSARLAATSLGADLTERGRYLRLAAHLLASVCTDVADDDIFVSAVRAAGLLDDGPACPGTPLGDIAARLSPGIDLPTIARLDRLWPALIDSPPLRERPVRSSDPQDFLHSAWLDQLVAYASPSSANDIKAGRYSIDVSGTHGHSFTFEVSDSGELDGIVQGSSMGSRLTTIVTSEQLADHLDGTARFSHRPDEEDPEHSLWVLDQVAPAPDTIRTFTRADSWPSREASSSGHRFSLGTDDWLSSLVAESEHRPSHPLAPSGRWGLEVVDEPASSFAFRVSPDQRLIEADRDLLGVSPERLSAVRRERLREVLDTRPRQESVSAISVLAMVAADIEAFTDPAPPRHEFLTAEWLGELLCRAVRSPDLGTVDAIVVPVSDASRAFELKVHEGVLTTCRPVVYQDSDAGTPHLLDAGTLWDIMFDGDLLPAVAASDVARILRRIRPTTLNAFTRGSARLGVPPGAAARRRQLAADRRVREAVAAHLRGVRCHLAVEIRELTESDQLLALSLAEMQAGHRSVLEAYELRLVQTLHASLADYLTPSIIEDGAGS